MPALVNSSCPAIHKPSVLDSCDDQLPFISQPSVCLLGLLQIPMLSKRIKFANADTVDIFMEGLLDETIPGAASDSSARFPTPRCHPGTRLAILERCLYFVVNCSGQNQMRWVVGAAGVGKTAILQSVSESPRLPVANRVSIFFSVKGCDDGTKAITTLCYQLADKSTTYRRVIEDEISRDPSLLQSSMTVQFEKLIIEPFIHNRELNSAGRILIIIDGLNECKNTRTQLELLRLISDFCIKYPSSPLVWLIASRPEQHITSFFDRANVMPAYEKEKIPVDSDDARADVERFLRAKLKDIKASYSLDPGWPEKPDFWKLANAAGGLFAYAHTVIRYISDPDVGNPATQFSEVLEVIDNHSMAGIPREEHPTALLDALYAKILSDVTDKVNIHARKLILALASGWFEALAPRASSFVMLCNWLAMSPDEAYAAIKLLQAVLLAPKRDKAHLADLVPFHRSFIDYVSDSSRSDFFRDIRYEAQQLKSQCALRILQEAPGAIDLGDVDYRMGCGILKRGTGTADRISLAWPDDRTSFASPYGWTPPASPGVETSFAWAPDRTLFAWLGSQNDNTTRLIMYKMAIGEVVAGIRRGDPIFQDQSYIRVLTSQFENYDPDFPFDRLHGLLFEDESRRHEFIMHGVLEEKPLKMVTISTIFSYVKLQFRRSATTGMNLPDPWNPSCTHEREVRGEGGQDQGWKTAFWWRKEWLGCAFCSERLKHQWANWKARHPNNTLPILFTSAGACCVEVRFVDADTDSEWIYGFWYHLSQEELKLYGSAV